MSTPYNPNNHNYPLHPEEPGTPGASSNRGTDATADFGAPAAGWGSDAGQYPYPAPQAAPSSNDGFFGALFDFSFSRFITIDFIKVIYGFSAAIVAVLWVLGLISSLIGFADGVGVGFFGLIIYLVVGTLVALLTLIWTRMGLEFFVANIKTAQNTSRMVEGADRRR